VSTLHGEHAALGPWRAAFRDFRRRRAAFAGACFVVLVAVVAALYPVIETSLLRFTVVENHPCSRYQPPGMRGVPREHHRLFEPASAESRAADANRDGAWSAAEVSAALSRDEFDRYDMNRDGRWDASELDAAPRSLTVAAGEVLRERDVDRSGGLEPAEAGVFVDVFPDSESRAWVRARDRDGDGLLSAGEFPGLPRLETFWLGTDGLGRDLAIRLVYGARVSLTVALLATLVSLFIGVAWGAVAAWVGGRVDAAMMRFVDVMYGLPFMFLVILLMVVFGRDIRLLYVAIGAMSWLTMARIVRGQVLALKDVDYVHAARAIGASNARILAVHVVPNILGPIIVYATLTIPEVMLQEAFLSFLGLGVQAPFTSWGALANEGARSGIMVTYPWLILAPGIALTATLFALNFVGEGLRDVLDPRTRTSRAP
jgi:oligopeptide transport system permease protein